MAGFVEFSDKDPNAVEPFRWDFGPVMAELDTADTIVTAAFTVPSGITKDSSSNTTTTATVVLSGGTAGESYDILCRITTAQGRTLDKTFRVNMAEQ